MIIQRSFWQAILAALLLAGCATPSAAPVQQPSPQPPPERTPSRPPVTTPPVVTQPSPPVSPSAPEPASVQAYQRREETWQPITRMEAYAFPGPVEIRLDFSKPVRQAEVEAALTEAQQLPVRGLMQWVDEKSLIWYFAEMPARLDFLLGGAHDQDGVPLPGGIPSLRLGEPPQLLAIDVDAETEQPVGPLPPDVLSAALSDDGTAVNLMVWIPGATRWDWQISDLFVDLQSGALKRGRVEGVQPRLPTVLESWVVNPQGSFVAGLRTEQVSQNLRKADLVLVELRGGRQQVFPAFIDRFVATERGELTTHLAWSGDGQRVAGLSHRDEQLSDLIVMDMLSGERTVLAEGLAVPATGTRLAWSPDSRYLLVGNLLLDLRDRTQHQLPGVPGSVRGVWSPNGERLLYGADWDIIFVVDPASGVPLPLGTGLGVGWKDPHTIYLIRWPGSDARYLPPGAAHL